jgi:hypothetical protein
MLHSKDIMLAIQELESIYADELADGAPFTELNSIWGKIKALKKQLIFTEIIENSIFNSVRPKLL